MQERKKIHLGGMLVIVCIVLFMYRTCINRPISYLVNEKQADYLTLKQDNVITQMLDIFHEDRYIDEIMIRLSVPDTMGDNLELEFRQGEKIQKASIENADIGEDGWYKLPFQYEQCTLTPAELKIRVDGKNNGAEISLAEDTYGLGECVINGQELERCVQTKVKVIIKNTMLDWGYKIFIPLYFIIAMFGLKYIHRRKENSRHCRIAMLLSMCANFLCISIFIPNWIEVPQIAENSLNFYYLTETNSLIDGLFKADAGYLPLLQRLIAVIWIKGFHLGTNALYMMQITGVILDCFFSASICLFLFRKIATWENRFCLSLAVMAMFVNSTVSTYFNFVYLGYLFLIILLISDLSILKKYQFVILVTFSAIICLSKGLYVVFFPAGVIFLLFFSGRMDMRKIIYISIITIASFTELFYALCNDGLSKWFDLSERFNVIAVVTIMGIGLCIAAAFFFRRIVSRYFTEEWVNISILTILALGSFCMVLIIEFKMGVSFNVKHFLDWGGAWYIPCHLALLVLVTYILCNCCCLQFAVKYLRYVLLTVYIVLIFGASSYKWNVNYGCVPWSVYKNMFSHTIVPVFNNAERFGTAAEGMTLWYYGNKPVDNYEYGAPYDFYEIKKDRKSRMPEAIEHGVVTAIYFNYVNNVGNEELTLVCYDKNGSEISRCKQETPLASKTIGFILGEGVKNIQQVKLYNEDNQIANLSVDENVIVVTSGSAWSITK